MVWHWRWGGCDWAGHDYWAADNIYRACSASRRHGSWSRWRSVVYRVLRQKDRADHHRWHHHPVLGTEQQQWGEPNHCRLGREPLVQRKKWRRNWPLVAWTDSGAEPPRRGGTAVEPLGSGREYRDRLRHDHQQWLLGPEGLRNTARDHRGGQRCL